MTELTHETEACLALGYFDSVHLGHRRILSIARKYALEHGLTCAVATFINNAYKMFNPDDKCVYTYAERKTLLDMLCDCVLPMRFDKRFKDTSAEAFLDWLFDEYNIKAVVCGYDYLFGAGAKGDAEFLKRYCKNKGVECIVADKFEYDGLRVSTTLIKDFLTAGEIDRANEFLGGSFFITGKVVHGRGAGRLFDIPTANLKFSADKFLPKRGVYATYCNIGDKTYVAATNIGAKPTFGLSKPAVETMLRDFDDNIYDKEITVEFVKYLRPVQKFDTPALLSKQVHEDLKWDKR